MRATAEQGDRTAWSQADIEWREILANGCPNSLLGELTLQMRNRTHVLSVRPAASVTNDNGQAKVIEHNPFIVATIIAFLGLMIGLAKGGFNALGALLTPILSLILPVSLAVGVLLPMLIVGDAFAIYTYWREWDGKLVWRMLPAGVVGALAGTYLLAVMAPNTLRIALGLFVLILVLYKFVSDRIQRLRYEPRAWHAPAAGALAGLASGMFNNGGPPFNSYLLLQKMPPRPFIATTALFFALLNLIKVPGFLYTGVLNVPLLLSFWWVFLFIPLGIWLAQRMITRLNQQAFEWVVIVLLVLASALLFLQSR